MVEDLIGFILCDHVLRDDRVKCELINARPLDISQEIADLALVFWLRAVISIDGSILHRPLDCFLHSLRIIAHHSNEWIAIAPPRGGDIDGSFQWERRIPK